MLHQHQSILDIKISKEDYIYILVVYGIGGIYYIVDPRSLLMRRSLKSVNENIKDKLLAPFVEDPEIKDSLINLREGNKLIDIFYHILDQDDSLKERAKEVYFNGLIWSSLIDIVIISPIGAIIYFLVFLITKNMHYMFYIDIGFIILSIIFIPLVIKKHYRMSNNQLNYIIGLYKKELRDHLSV